MSRGPALTKAESAEVKYLDNCLTFKEEPEAIQWDNPYGEPIQTLIPTLEELEKRFWSWTPPSKKKKQHA
jgi:hypothetical protein